MELIVVHHHLRPGGVRRVIELALPHLARAALAAGAAVKRVTLACGEPADDAWTDGLRRELRPARVEYFIEPSFGYVSEQPGAGPKLKTRIAKALELLLDRSADALVWAHNLGLGRNLALADALGAACHARGIPLVAHHHDWWFDNRWRRWGELRRTGYRTLEATADALFGMSSSARHACINREDYRHLRDGLGARVKWVPNMMEPLTPPGVAATKRARQWLTRITGEHAPVWLLPCRLLRRKNIGEALLLARWLRPGAWVITTGGPSSKDEHPYERKLRAAAEAEGWRLKLGALASAGGEAPSVRELLEASEVVLMTSIQEGFGLPYLEAAGAARPLAGRGLSNIMPDLRWLGFRFPQLYKSLLIPPDLFDARAEQARQRALFRAWKERLPGPCRAWARAPEFLRRPADSAPVDFARLTLTAQLEVLRKPVEESWAACASLNPFLRLWRSKAEAGRLEITPWPEAARDRISGVAYGRQLFEFARKPTREADQRRPAWRIQAEFMRARLSPDRLYPLLWSIES